MAMQLESRLADRSRWKADHCSIAKAFDVIGTRSAVLILREAYYGTTRFDDFVARVGITEASTAARLKELTAIGIFGRQPYKEPGRRTRYEYRLTEMGRDLLPMVLALMQWGDKYLQGERGGPLRIIDDRSGDGVRVDVRTQGGKTAELDELLVTLAPRRR